MEACGQGERFHSLVETLGLVALLKSEPPKQDRQEQESSA